RIKIGAACDSRKGWRLAHDLSLIRRDNVARRAPSPRKAFSAICISSHLRLLRVCRSRSRNRSEQEHEDNKAKAFHWPPSLEGLSRNRPPIIFSPLSCPVWNKLYRRLPCKGIYVRGDVFGLKPRDCQIHARMR